MKKLIITLAALILSASAAYAAETEVSGSIDMSGESALTETVEVTGLEDGYYDIIVYCTNTSTDNTSYISVKSDGYTDTNAVIPVLGQQGTVKAKGVYTKDGELTIEINKGGGTELEIEKITAEESESYEFLKGGDITELTYVEDMGGKFYNADGEEEDALKILADNGMNLARIRLYNDPGKGRGDGSYYLPEGYQNEEDTLELARRAKEYGMQIQYTFHYSDYWSNGERQIIPADWVQAIKDDLGYDVQDSTFLNSMTPEVKKKIQDKLGDLVYEYTKDIMTKLKEQGTTPEYVSIGNEINGGILFPFANTFNANMNSERFELVYDDNIDEANDIKCYEDWAGLAAILNRGYDAIKEVSPESQVIIHLAEGSRESVFDWFLKDYEAAGGKYDVIGASYYPWWSGNTVETAVEFCNNISARYDKDIIIMETGYNWTPLRKDGYAGQLSSVDSETGDIYGTIEAYKDIYPATKEGHKGFMAELFNGLKNVEGGRCIGDIYWDPVMIHVEDENGHNITGWAYKESDDTVDANVVENTTLFDFDGVAIPTLDIFAYNTNQKPVSDDGLVLERSEKTENGYTFIIKNTSDEEKNAVIYGAGYSSDGVLESVKIADNTIAPGMSARVEMEFEHKDGSTEKVFFWNKNMEALFADTGI